MKKVLKVVKKEIVKSESALKRAKATKLDIAILTEAIQGIKADACKDLDLNQKQILLLEDKVTMVDNVIHSIGENIAQCQTVIVSVKDTLDVHARDRAAAHHEAEHEHEERYAALDDRMNALGELIRSIDERNTQQYEAIQSRIQMLEERLPLLEDRVPLLEDRIPLLEDRIPLLETNVKTLDNNVDRIGQFQLKINARIITVMRMSLMIIGVLVVATVVLGLIFYKH
jgi:chromosome segregation ATPase